MQNTTNVRFQIEHTQLSNTIVLWFLGPCEGGKACGECAGCRVVNHVAQCSCPANYYGNALINCAKTMIPCDGSCECDEIGFCTTSCHRENDCSCGEVCHSGKCRIKCDINNACPKVNYKKNLWNYLFFFLINTDIEMFNLKIARLIKCRVTYAMEVYAWSVVAPTPTARRHCRAQMASVKIHVLLMDRLAE